MLIDVNNLPYESDLDKGAHLIGYAIKGILAIDPLTLAEMHSSNARRKYGRPTRYFILAPNGIVTIHYFRSNVTPDNPRGRSASKGYSRVFGLTAYTDEE